MGTLTRIRLNDKTGVGIREEHALDSRGMCFGCGQYAKDCHCRFLLGVPDDLGDLDWEAAEETYLDMLVTPATTREAVEAVVRAALGLKEDG